METEKQAIPGPWYYRRPLHPASFTRFEVNARNNGIFKPHVCDVRSLDVDGQDNSEANARLIAAAPILLAALEYIVEVQHEQQTNATESIFLIARGAIASAKAGT